MSRSALISRRILVVGPALSALAQSAMPQAQISAVTAEAALAYPPAEPVDLIILDAGGAPPLMMAQVIGAVAAMRPAPPALLVGAQLPAALFRALLKLQRSDVLDAPFALTDLARAAGELIDGDADEVRPKSRCWSVMGAVGGAGSTTLAVELATLLADRSGPGQTCLVDLNLADGAAAAYLGGTPNLRLADASVTPASPPSSLDPGCAGRLRRGSGGVRTDGPGPARGPGAGRRGRGRPGRGDRAQDRAQPLGRPGVRAIPVPGRG